MAGDVTPYTSLITSEHNDKPNFMAVVTALLQPCADLLGATTSIPAQYDLDVAVGGCLDVVGQWIGRSRYLTVAITGVYFAFDTPGVGCDEGTWQGPYDPIGGQTALADDAYRTLLRAVIVANHWDGTVPDAYFAWNAVFAGTGVGTLLQDNCNMSMVMALLGPTPDAVTLALFEGGYLSLRPAGVHIENYVTPTLADTPYFGFDVEGTSISGFDVGAFGLYS